MSKSKTPKLFKRKFEEHYPMLDNAIDESVDTKKRFDPGLTNGKRLTLSKNCGVSSQAELEQILAPLGATVLRPAEASGGTKYKNCGFLVEWNGSYYSTLVKGMAADKPRKAFSPDNIGLGGKTYTPDTLAQFRKDVNDALKAECGTDTKLFNAIISLLTHVETGQPVSNDLIKMPAKDRNPIVCDFGEVVCAYRDLLLGIAKKKIEFPIKSNENVVDYWRDDEIISVKGPLGGGKLNLVMYMSKLNGQCDVAKFLLAHAEHDRENYFKYAAKICPWVETIANLVGGTTIQALEKFVKTPGSFDRFYQLLEDDSFPGVGLPKKRWEGDWKRRWEIEHSLNPIWFSIITVMTRWGETDQDTITKISKVMKPLFSTEKFVNIGIDDVNIFFNEVPFVNVVTWSTHYHSNAGGAWANWPSIKVLETK